MQAIQPYPVATLLAQSHAAPTNILQNTVVMFSKVVFSKNYLPLSHIHLKRAVVLLVTGQAESLKFGGGQRWQVRFSFREASCTLKKGDRLSHETNMILKVKPKALMHPALVFAGQFWKAEKVRC